MEEREESPAVMVYRKTSACFFSFSGSSTVEEEISSCKQYVRLRAGMSPRLINHTETSNRLKLFFLTVVNLFLFCVVWVYSALRLFLTVGQ